MAKEEGDCQEGQARVLAGLCEVHRCDSYHFANGIDLGRTVTAGRGALLNFGHVE